PSIPTGEQTPASLPPTQYAPPPASAPTQLTKDASEPAAMPSGRTWQRSWDGINRFFGKYRIIAWICFMMLSAILGIWVGQIVHSNSCYADICVDPIESVFLFGDVGIGAVLIGQALLLANGRAIVDIIGGIAFTLLGDILLFY